MGTQTLRRCVYHALLLILAIGVAQAARLASSDTENQLSSSLSGVTSRDIDKKHHEDTICHRWDWRKKSLKLISEMPASGLFKDLRGYDKFEISGITRYKGQFVTVFDSLAELGFIDIGLNFYSPDNKLSGKPGGESEYEAITHRSRTDTLLAVVEGVHHPEHDTWHALVKEIIVEEDGEIDVVRECFVDYKLSEGDKKGFEGADYIDAGDRGELLFGLCEGNYCEGPGGRGTESGNGRIVVSALKESASDGPFSPSCTWETQKVINVPPTADFTDYSDIDIHGDKGIVRVGITSQEDAALWVGWLDLDKLEFVNDGVVLHFPRSHTSCEAIYCNIEGIHFIDEMRIMTTTDRAKKDQPWECSAKDQSVQIFALPRNKYLHPPDQDQANATLQSDVHADAASIIESESL